MEESVDIGLGSEALHLYLIEVKGSQQELEYEEEENLILNGK